MVLSSLMGAQFLKLTINLQKCGYILWKGMHCRIAEFESPTIWTTNYKRYHMKFTCLNRFWTYSSRWILYGLSHNWWKSLSEIRVENWVSTGRRVSRNSRHGKKQRSKSYPITEKMEMPNLLSLNYLIEIKYKCISWN